MKIEEKDRLSKETWNKICNDRAALKMAVENIARVAMKVSTTDCGWQHQCSHDTALSTIIEMCAMALGDLDEAA